MNHIVRAQELEKNVMDCDRRDEKGGPAEGASDERDRDAEERVRAARRRAKDAARDAFREEWRHRRESHRKRKGHVLHTRISEDLSDDIRRLADDLRVPVSNLVRNVLEEAFSVAERVSDDFGGLVDEVLEEAESARERFNRSMGRRGRHRHRRHGRRQRHSSDEDVEQELRHDEEDESSEGESARTPKEFPDVFGWQPLVLNGSRACADCGVQLQKGERAFLGVTASGMSPTTLCAECVRGL
jgi:flagellar biosynthesis regulator FlaF